MASPAAASADRVDKDELRAAADLQREMSGIFSDLADLFGNPPSLGAIYGALFASPVALSMEELVERLQISTGTASQGLRRLLELEAITPHKPDGERVTSYTARLELRPFVGMFLEQQLLPRLNRSTERIAYITARLHEIPAADREVLEVRLGRAAKWHSRAKTFLPMIRRFLSL